VNAIRIPKTARFGGRAHDPRAKAAWSLEVLTDAKLHSDGVHGDSTAARKHRTTGEALLAPGRNPRRRVGSITGDTGK